MAIGGRSTATILSIDDCGVWGALSARHGGRRLAVTADCLVVAYDTAGAAVAAALDHTGARTRAGLASGDVTWDGDDCRGPCVAAAMQLMDAGQPGQVLATAAVRLLVGAADVAFAPAGTDGEGDQRFRLLPVPDSAGPPAGDTPPLPPALSAPAEHPLVGRHDALATLVRAWEAAQAGPGRVTLVGGEAGAGKTRLVSELAWRVAGADGWVVYGGCHDDLTVPYQPWVQAVDQLLAGLSPVPVGLAAELAPLAPLLPRVERIAGGARSLGIDAETERYRTYGAFAAALAEATRRRPALVVVDDLHWAATQTLAVLRYLARSGLPQGVMVVGTFRDTGDEVTEPLASCLADLRRIGNVGRVRLTALDGGAVERFVADATGRELDDDLRRLAAGLAERSGGNPFFLCELWRHLEGGGRALTGVPDSVREVVSARVTGLSAMARQIVEIAALSGERMDLRVVREATGLALDALDAGLEELVDAGVLSSSGELGEELRFAHAIVREAVAAPIQRGQRAALHAALARAIEHVYEADRRPVLADLARHFAAAGGPSDRVTYYGRRAAALAMRAAAYDEAIAHLRAVLASDPSPLERAEVLIDMGTAHLRNGSFEATREVCAEAFRLASAADNGEVAGRAAVGFEFGIHFPGLPGDNAVVLLRRALAMLGDEPSPMRSRVLASLGRALAFTGRIEEGQSVGEAAVAEARAVGGDESLAIALQGLSTVSLADPWRTLDVTAELDAVAARLQDPWGSAYARANKMRALIELGRLAEAAEVLAEHEAAISTRRFATFEFLGHAFQVVLSLAAGDLVGAEDAADRAAAKASTDGAPFDAGVYGLQMYAIRRAQGRLAEVAPAMRAVAGMPDPPAMWRPALAAIYTELGMLDDARAVFGALAADRFSCVPRDAVWPACLTFLAETAIALRDVAAASVLFDELRAYAGRNLMAGMTICFGSADRLLGGLALVLGRTGAVDAHFAAAVALGTASGSPLWTAEAQYDWAVALAARGERQRAAELGEQAVSTARDLGIGRLADRPIPGGAVVRRPDLPGDLSAREVEVLVLIATGRSNREIGQRLYISQNTVANHVRAILRKTACANRAEAAAYATRHGLT